MGDKNNLVIGITGTNSAGKDTVANFFKKEKGFNAYSHSDELRNILEEKGVPKTRDSLFSLGNKLREKEGGGALSKIIIRKLKKPAVILSIRHPKEVEVYRRNLKNFHMLSVDAPRKMRYERAVKRNREGEGGESFEKFIEKDKRELEGKGSEQQITKVIEEADVNIQNDSTIENLYNKLDKVYKELINNG